MIRRAVLPGVEVTVSQAVRVQGVTCEVQQLLGEGTIRCVAMEGTEGLRKSIENRKIKKPERFDRKMATCFARLPDEVTIARKTACLYCKSLNKVTRTDKKSVGETKKKVNKFQKNCTKKGTILEKM